MIPNGTVEILWRHSELHPKYKITDLKTALAMRKEFLHIGCEVKIIILKEGEWVTVSETKGWNHDT